MKNFYIKLTILAISPLVCGSFFVSAQSTSTQSIKSKEVTQVEVSLPIEKSDFLLFYGVTSDEDVNSKIEELRSEFISKYKDLKKEYKDSFDAIVKDKELSPIVSLEPAQDTKAINNKEIKKEISKNLKAQVVPTVKKYILNEKSQDEEDIIPASVNIVNDKSNIHIENSSWFQKVKSWFNW